MVKKTLIISYILLFLAFSLPWLLKERGEKKESSIPPTPPVRESGEEELPITIIHQGEPLTMDMHSYLTGVVAAEMPAAFPVEALKAQAVAARTYAAYCTAEARHDSGQLCSYSGCCQAWMDEPAMRERWGADYELYHRRIADAVRATAGQYLSYQGQPVLAAFHSSSPGATESSASVWNELPYLVSVKSPETAENLPQLVSCVRVAELDFRDVLLSQFPEADLSGEAENWLGPIKRNESGRVESMSIGGAEIAGTRLRQLFSLRSTAFEVKAEGGEIVFTVWGFGHGVGMSQYGAQLMAQQGADYIAILAHYYPGTELVT